MRKIFWFEMASLDGYHETGQADQQGDPDMAEGQGTRCSPARTAPR